MEQRMQFNWEEMTESEFDALPASNRRALRNELWQPVMDAIDSGKTIKIEVRNDQDANRKIKTVIRRGLVRGIQVEVRRGDGFIAATSMNSDGKVTLPAARDTVTLPSSIGCRITSSVERLNSGNSSRKRTPLWARLTSPGAGMVEPPNKPTSEIV